MNGPVAYYDMQKIKKIAHCYILKIDDTKITNIKIKAITELDSYREYFNPARKWYQERGLLQNFICSCIFYYSLWKKDY